MSATATRKRGRKAKAEANGHDDNQGVDGAATQEEAKPEKPMKMADRLRAMAEEFSPNWSHKGWWRELGTVPEYVLEVKCTPEIARMLFARNVNNRKIKEPVVQRYVRDIQAGRWNQSGEAIKFNKKGELIDGQQRLAAIMLSGKTVTLLMVFDREKDVMVSLDTGSKRSTGDQLYLYRGTEKAGQVAAAARLCMRYEAGMKARTGNDYSSAEVVAWVDDHSDDMVVAMDSAKNLRSLIPVAIAGAAVMLTRQQAKRASEQFWKAIINGAELAADSPELQLIKACQRLRARGHIPGDYFLYVVAVAWNAYRNGETLGAIRVPQELPTGADFPVFA